MKVSLLISTYNGGEDIVALLFSIEKLEKGPFEVEIIIRDDNSSDNTLELVRKSKLPVMLLEGKDNLGFVRSNNILFKHASGDIVCCINQDSILEAHYLTEGVRTLLDYPDVAGVNINMLMPWVLKLKDFEKTRWEDMPSYEYQLTSYGFIQYKKMGPGISRTKFISGGGFLLRRSAIKADEELFDPRLHMYCEDTELSIRLLNRGEKLVYNPRVIQFHNQVEKKIGTMKGFKKLFSITWNRFYVMAKHLKPATFLLQYPWFLWGIVKKVNHLGISLTHRPLAYLMCGTIMIPFFFLFPYWFWHSFIFKHYMSRYTS